MQTMENKENENLLAQKVIRDVVKGLVKQVIKSGEKIDKNRLKSTMKNEEIGHKEMDLTQEIPSKTGHESKKSFQCSVCNKMLSSKGNLKIHVLTVHEQKKPFECSECHKSFRQKGNLKIHLLTVHERNKPFHCSLCEAKFGFKIGLKNHLVSVHEKILFQCTVCHKRFSRKPNLKEHVEAVHERKKPFQCSLCQAKFGKKSSLKDHLVSVHDLNSAEQIDKNILESSTKNGDNDVEMIDLSQGPTKPTFRHSTDKNSILKSKQLAKSLKQQSVKNPLENSMKAGNNGEEIIDLTLDSESLEITPKIDVVIDSEGKEKLQCSLCTVCLLWRFVYYICTYPKSL